MSREIKYQAWDKEEKRMSKVLLIDWINECVDLDEGVIERDFNQVELLEYIGRKDEDEREIYEEDIVQVIEQGHNMGFYYENEYVGIVKYDDEYCAFKLELIKFVRGGEPIPDEIDGIPISYDDESEMDDYCFSEWIVEADMKILGNAFENPELLKGE